MNTVFAPFIVIEGMDGSGKTTLTRRIEKAFALMPDYRFVFTREPGGTPLAEAVRGILLDTDLSGNASGKTQLLGFFYARAHHLETIRKQREQGFAVISDRFDGSTFAYQVYAQSDDTAEQKELADLFWALRTNIVCDENAPTLYLYLDLPPETAYFRRTVDASQEKNHYDTRSIGFYRRQRDGYRNFFAKVARQDDSEVAFIDATLAEDEVFEEVFHIIRNHVRSC
jgi:dTMP kinase